MLHVINSATDLSECDLNLQHEDDRLALIDDNEDGFGVIAYSEDLDELLTLAKKRGGDVSDLES